MKSTQKIHFIWVAVITLCIGNIVLTYAALPSHSTLLWGISVLLLIVVCGIVLSLGQRSLLAEQQLTLRGEADAQSQILLQTAKEITGACDGDTTPLPLDDITKRLTGALGVEYAAVFLHDKASDNENASPATLLASSSTLNDASPLQHIVGLVDRYLHSNDYRDIYLMTDLAANPPALRNNDVENPFANGTLQTLIFSPLHLAESGKGVIVFGSASSNALHPAQQDLLRLVSGHIAGSLRGELLRERLDTASQTLAAQHEQLQQSTSTDALTGLLNRQAFTERVSPAIAKAQKGDGQLSILMIDADHLKRINDRFGTLTGDEALQKIADVIQGGIRGWDVAARFGGDEFCVLLPATGGIGAVAVAERLRDQIAAIAFGDEDPTSLTATIGLACLSSRVTNAEELFAKADQSLMEGKSFGGNQVIIDWDQALEGVSEE